MNAKISEALGMQTMTEARHMEILPPESFDDSGSSPAVEQAAEEDRNYARENMKEIIETGTTALTDMLEIARATEDPRAFEVFSNIMKGLIDANKSLVGIHKETGRKQSKAPEADVKNQEENTSVTNNNNLFVGSTQELMDLIKKSKN